MITYEYSIYDFILIEEMLGIDFLQFFLLGDRMVVAMAFPFKGEIK